LGIDADAIAEAIVELLPTDTITAALDEAGASRVAIKPSPPDFDRVTFFYDGWFAFPEPATSAAPMPLAPPRQALTRPPGLTVITRVAPALVATLPLIPILIIARLARLALLFVLLFPGTAPSTLLLVLPFPGTAPSTLLLVLRFSRPAVSTPLCWSCAPLTSFPPSFPPLLALIFFIRRLLRQNNLMTHNRSVHDTSDILSRLCCKRDGIRANSYHPQQPQKVLSLGHSHSSHSWLWPRLHV
jgi:hypothetical protein